MLLAAAGMYEEQVFPYNEQGTITVYTPHEQQPMKTTIKEFQETCGIMVNIVSAGTGQLLERILQEQKTGKPVCDVFWGGGAESVAANEDLFESFICAADTLIPAESKDPGQRWVGESPAPVVIMYNTMLVSPQEVPTGWKDLLDPRWKGKIAFADPNLSGSAYTLLCTMLTAMESQPQGGWMYIQQLVENLEGNILDNSASVYDLVAAGEYYIGLTQEKSVQTALQAGAPVAIAYPSEGTSAVPDAIAIPKGCTNHAGALRFIDFVLDDANQNMMAILFNRRPVRTDLLPPEGLPAMDTIHLVDYDLAWAAREKQNNLLRWNSILSIR